MVKYNIKKVHVFFGLLIIIGFIVYIYRDIYNIPNEKGIQTYAEGCVGSKVFKRSEISLEDRKIAIFTSDKDLIECEYFIGLGGRCKLESSGWGNFPLSGPDFIKIKKNYYLVLYGVNPNNVIDNIKTSEDNITYTIKVPKGEYFLVAQRVQKKCFSLGHFTLFDKNNNEVDNKIFPNTMEEIHKKFDCINRSNCDIAFKKIPKEKDIKSYTYSNGSIKYKVCDKVYINLSVPLKSYIDDKNCRHYVWVGKAINNTLNDNYKFTPYSINTLIENGKPVLRGRGDISVKLNQKLNIPISDLKKLGFTKASKNYYYKIFNIDCKLCD